MKNSFIRLFSVLVWHILAPSSMLARNSVPDVPVKHSLVCGLEAVGMTGTGRFAPFWHTSDRQGIPSVRKDNGYMHFTLLGGMKMPSGLDLGYGADIGVGAGLRSAFFLHQLYVDLDYRWIELSAGMKERWGELKNHRISSGGLTWSGNSQPIPQVRIGTKGFTRIHVSGDWLSVKASMGYGRFTDDKWRRNQAESVAGKGVYTDGILFHSKDFFLRLGDADRFPLQATVGLEMYAMFGGVLHNRQLNSTEVFEEYRLPSGPEAYLTVFMPFNDAGSQGKENGNLLGSWHLSFDYYGQDWGVRAYYEHFYEDHSSMLGIEYKSDMDGNKDFVFYGFRRNWFDGLYGLEFKLPHGFSVNNVVIEVLNTRGQCGPIRRDMVFPVQEGVDGRDDMYNHQQYDSYSMAGYAIGNPVLLSPVYNSDNNQRFRSNRVLMCHLGVEGVAGDRWDYRALFTRTVHWGTYEYALNEKQKVTSCLLEGAYRLGDANGWKVGMSLGFDFNDGDMTGNNTGVLFSVSKSWRIL